MEIKIMQNELLSLINISLRAISLKNNTSIDNGKINVLKEDMESYLNLDEKDISLKGYSSMILSSSERIIKAYFGRINKKFEHISYNVEVSSIFTVSIDYLKNNPPEKYRAKMIMDLPDDFPFEKIPNGKNYNFWQRYHTFYFYNTKPVIWGMTANVLKDFLKFYK